MRGTLTALVVVVLVASGVWVASVSAVPGPGFGDGTTPDGAVDGADTVATVTTSVPNGTETIGSTTNTTDTTDVTATPIGTAENTTNTTATVTASVEDGTTNESIDAEAGTTDDATVDATVNDSVSETSVDAEFATNDSSVSVSSIADAGETVSVSADATVNTAGPLSSPTASDATRTSTRTGTPTPTGTTDETASGGAGSADDGATDSGTDDDVPAAATGAVLVGFGAAAATMLLRRSATVAALSPNVAATVSQIPSPFVQLREAVRKWLPRVLAAIGYSRYDDSDPLTHATRAELYERIAESPGTYLSELSEQTDVPTSTVRHHLDVLVNEGVVTTANVRGRRRYFSLDAGDEALAAALEDDASAAVIECLARTGPASVSTVAEELDRDVSTVSHHLGRLAEDDLVEREREGRSVYNDLAPEVEDALGADGGDRDTRRA